MEQKNKNESSGSLYKVGIALIILYIVQLLLSLKRYALTCFLILIICSGLVWINRIKIKQYIKTFFYEKKKLKQLEYFYITDDNKVIDLKKRESTFSLFSDLAFGTTIILWLSIIAFYYFLTYFFDKSILYFLFMISSIFIVTIGYGGLLVRIINKYITTTYVLIPVFSMLLILCINDSQQNRIPNMVMFIIGLCITILLYGMLGYFIPVHMLRKLNSRVILISSLFTIITTLIPQIVVFYFSSYFKLNGLTIDDIMQSADISGVLKTVIYDNPEIADIFNHFIENELLGQISTEITFLTTFFTISYIMGGLVITYKISKNKARAKSLFRRLILDTSKADYGLLVKCSFYGGDEYENLMLNNELMRRIILENEIDLEIPDISLKTRFIEFWKKYI